MCDSFHRLTTGKPSSINISKASKRILIKLYTQHQMAVGKVAYCFWSDRTGTLVGIMASDWNSGWHGNIYVLMEKSSSLKPQDPQV